MAKKKIIDKELLCIHEKDVSKGEVRKGFQKVRLRVTSWCGRKPVLEKRIMVLDLDGVWYPFKQAGMTYDDFQLVLENRDKIDSLLKLDGVPLDE